MITVLRQKYEYLVTYIEARMAEHEHGEKSVYSKLYNTVRTRHEYPAFLLYTQEAEELRKQITKIRKIQNSLKVEDRT